MLVGVWKTYMGKRLYLEKTKTVTTNLNEKNAICKTKNLLLDFFVNYDCTIDSC